MRINLLVAAITLFYSAGSFGFEPAEAPRPPVQKPGGEKPPGAGPLILEEAPELFLPRKARSQEEQNRLEGLALFAAGRMKEHQQDLLGALRLYQRALRYDPQALPVLEQIVPLAFSLNRNTEAIRYALKAVEVDPSNVQLLKRLAVHLTEQDDFEGAVKLYEKALSLEKRTQKDAAYVVMKLETGRLHYILQEYKKAAAAFDEVVDALNRPDDFGIDKKMQRDLLREPGKVYGLFGDCFIDSGQPDRAAAAYAKAQELAPDKAAHAFHQARVHALRKEHAAALEQLQAYLQAKGSSHGTTPYELLADVLKSLDRSADLVSLLTKAREQDQDNQVLGYFLAEQLRKANQLNEALAIYRHLHGKQPSVQSYQGLVAIYRDQKQVEPLLTVLGQCAAETGGFDSLGDELEALTKDMEVVTQVLKAAESKLSPKPEGLDYGGRLAAAMLALEVKQFDDAGKFFDLALQTKPKEAAEIYLAWGLGLLTEEKYAGSAQVFQRGIEARLLPKDNPAFHFYLSGALELAGQTDEALATARQAAEMAKDSPRMHSRVAWILYHAKRYDQATKAYADLIERFDASNGTPEGRQVLREARLVLSNLAVLRKNYPLAEEWLEQVLDEFPEDISARNDLGYLWADQGKNLKRALEMTRQAVAAEPENESYRDSLGWALFRLGRYEEALVELKKAASGEKPDAVILDHLGDCYHKLNDRKNALDCWRRALKQFDPQDHASEIKATEAKIQQNG